MRFRSRRPSQKSLIHLGGSILLDVVPAVMSSRLWLAHGSLVDRRLERCDSRPGTVPAARRSVRFPVHFLGHDRHY